MTEQQFVSRRASLKSLGALGAAIVLGGTAPIARQGDAKPATSGQDKHALTVVDLAVDRFGKGHS